MKQIKMEWYKNLGFVVSELIIPKKRFWNYSNFYALNGYGRMKKYETN